MGRGEKTPKIGCDCELPSALRNKPAVVLGLNRSRGLSTRFADDASIAYTPALDDYGPRLRNEVYFQQEEFNRMFQERRSLAIKAAKQRLKGIPSDHKPDPDESRRGLGIDPLESKILGPRKARNIRKKVERDQIFEYQKQASRDGEDWSHVYDEVAAQVNAEGSAAHQLTAESAAAAHKLAEAEHRQLFRESPSARYIFSVTAPARWRGG